MRKERELKKRIKDYDGVRYIYHKDFGYLAWQLSTGDNYEIMFIEVKETRKGHATELMKCFVTCAPRPFHSVFVVRLASNESAGHFYRHLGFKEYPIKDLYRGDDAVLAVIPWDTLVHNLEYGKTN